MKEPCKSNEHDYEHPIRLWRAKFICPKCKEDITLALVYIQEALTK